MTAFVSKLVVFNKTPSYSWLNTVGIVAGCSVILLALVSLFTAMQINDIIVWIAEHFGISFSVIFSGLVIWAIFAIVQINQGQNIPYWSQVGAQAANGISTLALTFTLLGISLGIGALSNQSLTPDNVNNVISILTTQFSMAFMTTVVGLPTATALRAYLAILVTKKNVSKKTVTNTVTATEVTIKNEKKSDTQYNSQPNINNKPLGQTLIREKQSPSTIQVKPQGDLPTKRTDQVKKLAIKKVNKKTNIKSAKPAMERQQTKQLNERASIGNETANHQTKANAVKRKRIKNKVNKSKTAKQTNIDVSYDKLMNHYPKFTFGHTKEH